jgi:hypothetical protein
MGGERTALSNGKLEKGGGHGRHPKGHRGQRGDEVAVVVVPTATVLVFVEDDDDGDVDIKTFIYTE